MYFAPRNYHLLVERSGIFSLSTGERVNFSRPSIDVLFQSAAWAWRSGVVGIVFTGTNNDGAQGLQDIAEQGGTAVVQNPAEAEHPVMPKAAIALCTHAKIMRLDVIAAWLLALPRTIARGEVHG